MKNRLFVLCISIFLFLIAGCSNLTGDVKSFENQEELSQPLLSGTSKVTLTINGPNQDSMRAIGMPDASAISVQMYEIRGIASIEVDGAMKIRQYVKTVEATQSTAVIELEAGLEWDITISGFSSEELEEENIVLQGHTKITPTRTVQKIAVQLSPISEAGTGSIKLKIDLPEGIDYKLTYGLDSFSNVAMNQILVEPPASGVIYLSSVPAGIHNLYMSIQPWDKASAIPLGVASYRTETVYVFKDMETSKWKSGSTYSSQLTYDYSMVIPGTDSCVLRKLQFVETDESPVEKLSGFDASLLTYSVSNYRRSAVNSLIVTMDEPGQCIEVFYKKDGELLTVPMIPVAVDFVDPKYETSGDFRQKLTYEIPSAILDIGSSTVLTVGVSSPDSDNTSSYKITIEEERNFEFVASTGDDDTGTGTVTSPFKSVNRALQAILEKPDFDSSKDYAIYLQDNLAGDILNTPSSANGFIDISPSQKLNLTIASDDSNISRIISMDTTSANASENRIINVGENVNLVLRNLQLEDAKAKKDGAAIHVQGTSSKPSRLTIDNCKIRNNTAYSNAGGALWIQGGLTVRDSSFANNVVDTDTYGSGGGMGGAINIEPSGQLAKFERCNIYDNQVIHSGGGNHSGNGGAICLLEKASFDNCRFTGNKSASDGTALAIFSVRGDVSIKDCEFSSNSVQPGLPYPPSFPDSDIYIDTHSLYWTATVNLRISGACDLGTIVVEDGSFILVNDDIAKKDPLKPVATVIPKYPETGYSTQLIKVDPDSSIVLGKTYTSELFNLSNPADYIITAKGLVISKNAGAGGGFDNPLLADIQFVLSGFGLKTPVQNSADYYSIASGSDLVITSQLKDALGTYNDVALTGWSVTALSYGVIPVDVSSNVTVAADSKSISLDTSTLEYGNYSIGVTASYGGIAHDVDFILRITEPMDPDAFMSLSVSEVDSYLASLSSGDTANINITDASPDMTLLKTSLLSYPDVTVNLDMRECTSLTELSSSAFGHFSTPASRCTNLETIKLPETITKIGQDCFSGCTALKQISIPESVTEISSYAFNDCTSLEIVEVKASFTTLPNFVFSGCTGIKAIALPASIYKDSSSRLTLGFMAGVPTAAQISFGGTQEQWTTLISEEASFSGRVVFGYIFKYESSDGSYVNVYKYMADGVSMGSFIWNDQGTLYSGNWTTSAGSTSIVIPNKPPLIIPDGASSFDLEGKTYVKVL